MSSCGDELGAHTSPSFRIADIDTRLILVTTSQHMSHQHLQSPVGREILAIDKGWIRSKVLRASATVIKVYRIGSKRGRSHTSARCDPKGGTPTIYTTEVKPCEFRKTGCYSDTRGLFGYQVLFCCVFGLNTRLNVSAPRKW